jgi:hypothetical protein
MQPTKLATVLFALALCVAGVAVLPAAAQSQQVQTPNATLVFTDQTTNGTTVQLNSVNLSQGGFVAIHNASLTTENDTIGSVIGVSERLSPGPHQDVQVQLYTLEGREFNQSRLRTNGSLTAMVHFDSNENNQFDFVRTNGSVDGPYVVGTGTVVESAEISVEREETVADGGFDIGPAPLLVGGIVLVVLVVLAAVVARRR